MKDKTSLITSKDDLREYLEADRKALGLNNKRPKISQFVYSFEYSLRHLEYYTNVNSHSPFHKIMRMYWKLRNFVDSIICGFEIPTNVFGKGLSIAHKGTIVVNAKAQVGENCRLHTCVNIGTAPGAGGLAPIIGNNVYIAPGAKIWGGIKIGDNVMIGANSCVGKNFPNDVCIAGAPARIIKNIGRKEVEEINKQRENQDNNKN